MKEHSRPPCNHGGDPTYNLAGLGYLEEGEI
jgi:hypothetical protein